MIFKGNLAVAEGGGAINYYWEIYTLMGDPSLQAYLGVPSQNIVSYPPVLFLGETAVSVSAEPYSYAALSIDGEICGTALADENGIADLQFLPLSNTGTAKLVVTAQNLQPFFSEIPVVAAGPYVVVESFTTTDNNNNIPEYNEIVSLNMTFKNVGSSTANNVTATISTADEDISITQNTADIGDLSSGEVITLTEAFTFDVADDIPDQHQVNFELNINANNSWISQIEIIFNAPVFTTGEMEIIDDNGNGLLEPGESAEIYIPVINSGSALSPQVTAQLNTITPELISINNSYYTLEALGIGEQANAIFPVEVNTAAPQGSTAILDIEVTAGEYGIVNTYYTAVGNIVEDFESGIMHNFPWILTGSEDWEINDNSYEGNYCTKSGNISDGDYSSMKIEFSNIVNGTFSFWKKVSSEGNSDYLKFYLDGEQIAAWSGDQDWILESIEIAAGDHIAEWKYVKDHSGSSGNDCAWIDYITFPTAGLSFPPLLYTTTAMLNVELAAGQTSQEIIEISNIGGGDLEYTASITGNNSWLNVEPANGVLTSGETEELIATLDAAGLSTGQYSSAILLQYNGNEQYLIVVILDVTSTENDNDLLADETRLHGNYPNPFNPTTTISFNLSSDQKAKTELSIYNLKGQKVRKFNFSNENAGTNTYSVIWNGDDDNGKPVSSGIYFYKLKTGDFLQTKKMLLIK